MDEEEEQKRKHRNERRRQLYAEKKLTMQLQQQNMAGLRDDDKGKSSASLVLDQQRSHRNERRRQLYKERKEELNKTSQPRKKRRISCLAAVSEAAQEDGSNLDELHSGLPDDDKGKNSAALVRDQRRSHRNKRRRQLYNERKEEFNSAEGESSSRINKTSQPRKKRRISCLAAVSEVAQEDGYSLDALHSGFDCAVAAAPSTSKGWHDGTWGKCVYMYLRLVTYSNLVLKAQRSLIIFLIEHSTSQE